MKNKITHEESLFAIQVREKRKSAGLTQSELSDMANISRSQITNIENETTSTSVGNAFILARIFLIDLNKIYREALRNTQENQNDK